MQLYSFFNSSTSYRVRIALALKGLDYQVEMCIRDSLGGDVFLGDMEQRGGVEAVAARRLELQAEFPLLALGGRQGRAGGVGIGVRVERLGVADVGRQAVVEQVQRADPPGEFLPVVVGLAAGATVLVGDADPVLAQAEREAPLLDVDQVLDCLLYTSCSA